MHMVMGVDMVKLKPCLAKGLELRAYLGAQLAAGTCAEEILYAQAYKMIRNRPSASVSAGISWFRSTA
jgi:hypothetical protein